MISYVVRRLISCEGMTSCKLTNYLKLKFVGWNEYISRSLSTEPSLATVYPSNFKRPDFWAKNKIEIEGN